MTSPEMPPIDELIHTTVLPGDLYIYMPDGLLTAQAAERIQVWWKDSGAPAPLIILPPGTLDAYRPVGAEPEPTMPEPDLSPAMAQRQQLLAERARRGTGL